MKTFQYALIAAATVVMSACVHAEQVSSSAVMAPEQTGAEAVMAQERAWADALIVPDLEVVANLMHPHFRLVRTYNSEAPPISREMYLGTQGMTMRSYDIERFSVTLADNVAVVEMIMNLDWESEASGPLPPRFHLTDTWLNMDGEWKILARVSQVAVEQPAAAE